MEAGIQLKDVIRPVGGAGIDMEQVLMLLAKLGQSGGIEVGGG